VLKNEAIANLVKAIQAALRGERFVSPTAGPTRATVARRSAELDQRVLSDQEIEVLRQLETVEKP
jgi:DNA-binding NarL/FixJ family response regulator